MAARVLLLVALSVFLATTQVGSQSVTLAWDPVADLIWTVPEFRVYRDGAPVGATSALQFSVPVTPGATHALQVSSYGWMLDANLNTVWAEGVKSAPVFYTAASDPPPPPLTPSPDGTLVSAPAGSLVDCDGNAWSFGALVTSVDYATLRNGSHAAGGYGTLYKLLTCAVWAFGGDRTWYQWNGSGWTYTGQTQEPGTTAPPPPPSDTSAPVVSLALRQSGKSANWTATATASDNVGVVQIIISVNGQEFPPCAASPCAVSVKLGKGTYTFIAVAKDAAGNTGMAGHTVTN
jgi:hypothetical protein